MTRSRIITFAVLFLFAAFVLGVSAAPQVFAQQTSCPGCTDKNAVKDSKPASTTTDNKCSIGKDGKTPCGKDAQCKACKEGKGACGTTAKDSACKCGKDCKCPGCKDGKCVCGADCKCKNAQNTVAKLVILHTNDFHGNLKPLKDKKLDPEGEVGGSAYIAPMIAKVRAENKGNVLLLDAGDIAQGTPVSNYFKGVPVVEVMNYLKYDAMTIGNHEFDWRLPALQAMAKTAKFPILCANIVYEKTPAKAIFDLKPYMIKKVGGLKVGIIGLTTPETPKVTKVENVKGVKFLDPVATANKYIPQMKKEGADIIVALTHLGVDDDKVLAEKAKGIDIIVGGHSHTELMTPVKVGNTVILQTKSYGRFLGKMELTYDKKAKKIVTITEQNELIPTLHKDITPDPAVVAIIEKYNKQIAPVMEKEVGEAKIDLVRTTGKDHADSVMADLICDSMKANTNADVCIYNPGGVRSDIVKGIIKMEDIFKVLPFDNWLVTFNLTGADILKVLEHGAKGHGSAQVAGMTFTIDYSKPEGSRVSEVMVAGKPLDPAATYRVATIDFLYTGGDGFDFKKATDVKYGDFARDVLAEYVKEHSPISKEADKRIKVIGETK
ncbi:MAG: 5'-nucleotidase C-terminal domain-containing protein [Firmicutes bacterium]|nr:5'-nucleotidase C-terminal domain-containing protein [Bacillota bacterium]